MEYVKASELNFDSMTQEEFKEELESNEDVFLCKICSADITTYDNGICGACQDSIDYGRDNNYIEGAYGEEDKILKECGCKTINEYYDHREAEPNIKIINDL